MPIQSSEAVFTAHNAYLQQSLESISLLLKDYYHNKQRTGFAFDFDSSTLTKLLKKTFQDPSAAIHPLFFINSQEDFKDESKQLL